MTGLSSSKTFAMVVVGLVVPISVTQPAEAQILYVDDDAPLAGDGLGWVTAYRFLQDALTDAAGGGITEIRVAQGLYVPDRDETTPDGSGDREATFQLANGITLIGGHAGIGAPEPDDRDYELYETVLSGDLLGDDNGSFQTLGDNSYHVVTASGVDQSSVMDGFTITAGFASGPYNTPLRNGAGMFNDGGSPVVRNCTFSRCLAWGAGGGMYNHSANPSLSNCTFRRCRAPDGGGIFNVESNPIVVNCTFLANAAAPDCEDCAGAGGGMVNWASAPIVVNCTFAGNRAGFGGGMYNFEGSDAIVANCLFVGNSVVFFYPTGIGGGIRNFESSPTITNCTFAGNRAAAGGFGVCAGIGAGIATHGSNASPSVANCIFWDNLGQLGGEIDDTSGATTVVRYSDVQDGWSGAGSNNIDADPLFAPGPSGTWSDDPTYDPLSGLTTFVDSSASFVEGELVGQFVTNPIACFVAPALIVANTPTTMSVVGSFGWVDAGDSYDVTDYTFSPASPCIDAGDNTAVPGDITTDLDGNPRFVDDPATANTGNGVCHVDMGAYEFQEGAVVCCLGDLNGDGVVNVLDLIELVMSFGPCEACPADLDDDGFVGVLDLITLVLNFGPCPGTPCVWDMNGDGIVDQSDVLAVTNNLGPCEDPENCPWDVNGDGVVNGQDAAAVATHFGPCP